MLIRNVILSDIPKWLMLSKEYDVYVRELVNDLTEWYEGNEESVSYDNYMKAKITQKEAFIAVSKDSDECCGIIAISRKNNNITFFGISHKYNFMETGKLLLNYALEQLNINVDISVNIIKSEENHIQNQYRLFSNHGFFYTSDGLENGVPVIIMKKSNNGNN